jgi:hypothetical protein
MLRIALVAAALAAVAPGALGPTRAAAHTVHPGAPAYCSLNPLGGFGYELTTLFIASATGDSLPGGKPRRVRASMFRDDSITLNPPAYSQVVNVERLSRKAGSDLAKAIRRNRGRALLIPWEHGADCGPGSWTGEAIWLKPGTRGLFGANLRPQERWVNGIPTFDVGGPYYLPYPSGKAFASHIEDGNALSADELMSFFDALPALPANPVDRRAYLEGENAQQAAILKWAKRHPELRSRPPVKRLVEGADFESRRSHYWLRESPLSGTWRFTVTVPSGDTAVAYGRTQPLATGLIDYRDGSTTSVPAEKVFGYYLYTLMGRTEAELDIEPETFNRRGGFVSASFEPEIDTRDSTVWSAGVEILAAAPFASSASFAKHVPFLTKNAQYSPDPDRPRYAPGRIVRRRDGSLELTVAYGSNGQTLVEIRGKRISTKTWAQD